MANDTKKNTEEIIFKLTATLKFFGHGSAGFNREDYSQVSVIPDPEFLEGLKKDIAACYEASQLDSKWYPDFVTKADCSAINLKSQFNIPVLVTTNDKEHPQFETTVVDFVKLYGTPKAGTHVSVVMKFKGKSMYPIAIRMNKTLEDIERYSLASLFE